MGSRLFSRSAAGGPAPARGVARRCLLIGQPGAGRTLLLRRFTAYLRERGGGSGSSGSVSLPGTGITVELIDAGSLPSGIHPDATVRAAAARALRALLEADLCLHVADAAAVGGGAPVSAVDRALGGYAREFLPGRYALLASKADHPLGWAGRLKLERELAPAKIIPVSAVTGTGLRELCAFLSSAIV